MNRHFLTAFARTSRHRLRDHHHLHRSYDDNVVGRKRGTVEIELQNAQREKKILQLNEFIARFDCWNGPAS